MAQNRELGPVTFHEVFGAAKRLVGQRKRLQKQLAEGYKRELHRKFTYHFQEKKIDLLDEVANGATSIVLCDPHNPENLRSALQVATWHLGAMEQNVYIRNMSRYAKPYLVSPEEKK